MSWLLLTIFYVCFYGFLAGYFAIILSIYTHAIVDQEVPFLTGQQNLLRDGPGVGINPLFRESKNDTITSTLVYLTVGPKIASDSNFIQYNVVTDLLLNPYRTNGLLENQWNCTNDDLGPPNITQACQFDLSVLGPCANPVPHLQNNGIVCMFITLNKVYGWLPDVTNTSGPLIQCYGQGDPDTENAGILKYYPDGGQYNNASAGLISHVYFPFIRQNNYSTPLVAVEFANITQNVAIMMFCQVQNVPGAGTSQFEIMVDNLANATSTSSSTTSAGANSATSTAGSTSTLSSSSLSSTSAAAPTTTATGSASTT